MSTNRTMPPPTCENCGRDKSPTYICDACINKLNAATRAITAERDEWKRRCKKMVAMLDAEITSGISKNSFVLNSEGASRIVSAREMHSKALTIAEGRDNG